MSRSPAGFSMALIAFGAAVQLAACSSVTEMPQAPAGETMPPPAAQSTSAAASQGEDVKTFTIGDLPAAALRDGVLEFPNDNKIFGVGHTPGEVVSLLSAAGASTDKLHLSIQPLLVKTMDRVLLFDTGAGANLGPSGGRLSASLAAAGVNPQSVTDIFISHAHGDHIGGLVNSQGAPAFPKARIHLSASEWAFLKGMNAETAKNVAITQYVALIAAITPKVTVFAPGSRIIPGFVKAVGIKGHTPGHSGYLITSGQNSLLYIGDALHHYVVSVQKPEWLNSFDGDTATAAASRSVLLAQSTASGQRLYAVHFPFPGVGKIERRGDGFVWAPE